MKGDTILIKKEFQKPIQSIFHILEERIINSRKFILSFAGESGSGKTTSALLFSQLLNKKHISNITIHQDDYFFLPPKTNHLNRLKNIDNVGKHEVNLAKIQEDIICFINDLEIIKPLVDYPNNLITTENINTKDIQVLILEGTYISCLKNIDYKIFINKTYKDTIAQRIERNRDIIDDFSTTVLEIEHNIIKKDIKLADGILNNDNSFISCFC